MKSLISSNRSSSEINLLLIFNFSLFFIFFHSSTICIKWGGTSRIKIVPNNKINKAKLQSIHQIILLNTRQSAPEEQDRQQKSLLNFVNQTLTTELLNFQIHLQNIKEEIENLKAESWSGKLFNHRCGVKACPGAIAS